MRTVIAVPALLCALVVSCYAQPSVAAGGVQGPACTAPLGWHGELPCANTEGYGIRFVHAVVASRAVYGAWLLHCSQAVSGEECFTHDWDGRHRRTVYTYHSGEPSTHNGKPPADVPEGEY